MNSLSEYHFNEKTHSNEQSEKCNNCFSELIPGKAILRCNKSNLGTVNAVLVTPPFFESLNQTVASVTIDTTCMHCPKTLIDFSGTITNNFGTILSLAFTLFKSCKGSSIRQSVATFNYNISNIVGVIDSETIKFRHLTCDDQCDDCCTYTLELTSISSILSTIISFSIEGEICALAVDSGDCNCR